MIKPGISVSIEILAYIEEEGISIFRVCNGSGRLLYTCKVISMMEWQNGRAV